MANQNLNVRFTDEIYATRQEVARSLGTNLIDPIWNEILKYRAQTSQKLNLVDFTKSPYALCFGALMQSKLADVNSSNYNFKSVFNSVSKDSLDYKRILNALLSKCVKSIAKANGKTIDDVSVSNILKGENIDPQFSYLQRYLKAFDMFEVDSLEIDENLLADFYGIVTGNPELSEFYRNEDIAQKSNVLIGREYVGAPINLIESQMEALFSFVGRRDLPLFIRVSVVCYIFNYVKPFAQYNFEMSILLCKSMLVKELGEFAAYLPIEDLVSKNQLLVGTLAKEVQRKHDISYIVNAYLDILKETIVDAGNVFVHHSLKQLEEDQKIHQEEVKQESVVPVYQHVEKPKPVPQPIVQKEQPIVNTQALRQVSENTLSEKELQKLTEELLETDPSLKKGQAHFYIRHREKNHFYTIEQYRKCEGCVYETARTSMDHLVVRGYYRREKVNNKKFVYTPIFKD